MHPSPLKFQVNQTAQGIVHQYTQSPNILDLIPPTSVKGPLKPDLSALYRYEGQAVVVYDSSARQVDDLEQGPCVPQEKKPLPSLIKKDLETANSFGMG
jgi:hypothetical protein